MGVKGLWRLLMPIGRRISIETLEGKILAIDASIWLTQFLKAMRDPETGKVQPAAHLVGFFRRLAKLRFHGIRPVLIFDGATPEIKRREVQRRRKQREQFAASGPAAVQRMAKRLLLEQLKKRKLKSSDGGGAYAPGFQPAPEEEEEEDEEQKEPAKEQEQPRKDEEEAKDPETRNAAQPKSDSHDDIMEDLANYELEWNEQKPPEHNDWDQPVVQEEEEEEEDENDTSSSIMYKHTYTKFDADRISALPSHDRSAAVENAQRQQRMRSRREFMPVAGQPQEYSQAQLRNFLRSAKLNQQIVDMSKKVIGKDEEIGERVASDTTRRIVFTKDDDDQPRNARNRLQKKNPYKRLPPEEEDDEEFEWQDGDAPPPVTKPLSIGGVIAEEDDDSNDDGSAGGGFMPSSKTPPSVARKPAIQVDSDSDESEGGGGFMTAEASMRIRQKNDRIQGARRSQQSAGGFVDSNLSTGSKIAAIEIDSDREGSAGSMPVKGRLKDDSDGQKRLAQNVSTNARRAQELEDEILARALQESEGNPTDSGVASAARKPEGSTQINNDAILAARLQEVYDESGNEDDESGGGFMTAVDDSRALHLKGHSNRDDSKMRASSSIPTKPAARHSQELEDAALAKALQETEGDALNNASGKAFLGIGAGEASTQKVRNGAVASGLPSDGVRSLPSDDEESDAVDWEDGDPEQDRRVDSLPDIEVFQVAGKSTVDEKMKLDDGNSSDDVDWENGTVVEAEAPDDENIVARKRQTNSEQGVETTSLRSEEKSPAGEDNDFDAPTHGDQNAMALEHAQATAMNLTNWAGRAFRRAIAQHAEQTGVASPEKVIHHSKADSDDGTENEEIIDMDRKIAATPSDDSNRKAEPSPHKQTLSATTQSPQVNNQTKGGARANDTSASNKPTATIDLQAEEEILNSEQRRQERDMDTMTDEMKAEIIQLIELFGIPYVESPAEAEAQCVKLEELGLVHGIVTEDSDVFVFGGQTIYRNIFDEQKYVEAYLAKDAQTEMALGRNEMVALAMLLGGDYSAGVKGVGIVNGMEVLQTFDVSDNVKDGLTKFRDWLNGFDPDDASGKKTSSDALSAERKFHAKHKSARTQWVAPQNFPADNVLNAYLKPVVDASEDQFSWGTPDLNGLLEFCQRNIGWTYEETKGLLGPVMERLEDTTRQTRLESFFMKYDDNIKFADVKSKRLRDVFKGIQEKSQENRANKRPKTTHKT